MPIRLRTTLFGGIAALALLSGVGCRPAATAGDAASAKAGATADPVSSATADTTPMAADDPCRLLTTAEVRDVFPNAKVGVRERSREEYGIRACVWETPTGHFAVQQWTTKPGAVDNEIRGLSSGFLDPLNPAAPNNVRFETIAGIGEAAMAVIETRDESRGILSDVAMLVTQRGDRLLELQSPDLPRSERAVALKALTMLGRTAVNRL